ncbi:MAG TPA: Clp protease N-terminal domain-containing protein, partial [Ktedonobacterales bacterium]
MADQMHPRSLAEQDSFVGKVVEIAIAEAVHLFHDYLGVEHMLIALTRCEHGCTERALARLELKPELLRATLRARAGANHPNSFEGRLLISPRLRQMMERLRADTADAGGAQAGERLLLLAILQSGPGLAVRTLTENGVDLADIIAD